MIDHSFSDRVLELTFARLGRSGATLDFPEKKSLAKHVAKLIEDSTPTILHTNASLFASASVEMWQWAVHSFLWSVALTKYSEIWSSVTGYYASHYVMRAFAHAFGFFKSFSGKKVVQISIRAGHFVVSVLDEKERGEHSFYWKVVKKHPEFSHNPLFRSNSEKDRTSDCSHRNDANYTDHIGNFDKSGFPRAVELVESVEKISHIRRFAVTEVGEYPNLSNVQILAYQRIVTFRDFLDKRLPNNHFWRTHKFPNWCRGIITFELHDPERE